MLRDPEIPSLGNPKGDLTVVEFFDYQCPYCKKLAPEIAQLMPEDGNIRLVLKDWPIFGAVSKSAAQLALAAKYQDKYAEAHDALIGATTKLTDDNIRRPARQGRRRCRQGEARSESASKDDRRSLGSQQRPSRGLRLSGHAGLHRRHVPRAGRRRNESVQADHRRRPHAGEEDEELIVPGAKHGGQADEIIREAAVLQRLPPTASDRVRSCRSRTPQTAQFPRC